MVVLISKERVTRTLRNILEKLEENNRPIQTGRVKAVTIEKKDGTVLFKAGDVVFTKRGIGIVEDKIWPRDGRPAMLQVRHRKSGANKNKRIQYYAKEVMRLYIVDENGKQLPVSPMFYDHLIMSIGKDVKFYANNRNAAMLTKKQQQLLEKDRIASLKGAFNYLKSLKDKGLLGK